MRDLINSRLSAIQARTSKLHTQLDAAIHSECVVAHVKPKQRRRVVRSTVVCTSDIDIGTDMVGMAYRALTSDPTLRLKGKDVKATHIQTWIEDEYCTTVSEADVQVAMVAYSHTK